MVAVDPAAWDRQRKLSATDHNQLSTYDRDLIGTPVRVEIPFEDPTKLREIADLLRGLAETIEFTTEREDIPLRHRLSMIRRETMAINKRIRTIHGYSRKQR